MNRTSKSGLTQQATAAVCLLSTFLFPSYGVAQSAQFAPPAAFQRPTGPTLKFIAPKFGTGPKGDDVRVVLEVPRSEYKSTLRVTLNGKNIRSLFEHDERCDWSACLVRGTVSEADGLKDGENILLASVRSPHKSQLSATTKFDHFESGLGDGGNTLVYYDPVAVGFKTLNPGGGNPWIEIDTGYTPDIEDPVASFPPLEESDNPPSTTTIFTVPYQDKQFQINCGSNVLQAIALDRTQPSVEKATACGNTVDEIKSSLQSSLGALDASSLIVLGTTPGSLIPADFDTSSLGGHDYSILSKIGLRLAYMMIGVPGASAGTAYESVPFPPTPGHPVQYTPSLNGTLFAQRGSASNGTANTTPQYYNFLPGDDRTFQVVSGAKPSITVGDKVFTAPTANGALNADFWLLILDRESLNPVNYIVNGIYTLNCDPNAATQACGGIYDTHADGRAALASEISQLPSNDLIFLVSIGCPFDNSAQVSPALAAAVDLVGGVSYTLQNLNPNSNACAYSLVTSNDSGHQHALVDPVAFSASQFTDQKQLGAIHGFLARNKSNLYDVAGKDQMYLNVDPATNTSTLTGAVDYTFDLVTSGQRQDWPLTDSAGYLAAYHDISHQLLRDLPSPQTGSRLYDIRYYYTDSGFMGDLAALIETHLAPSAPTPLTRSSWDPATGDEFAAVLKAMTAELQQLNSAQGFLLGQDGFEGKLVNGLNGVNIFNGIVGMADIITKDQAQAGSQMVNSNLSADLNLAAGVFSIGSVIPGVGPLFGVISGALWTGSAITGLDSSLPSPENAFDVTLSDLSAHAQTYSDNLAAGFYGSVDTIFSDSAKLQVIGNLTANSDSGWKMSTLSDPSDFENTIERGAVTSLWLDVMPQLYGIRQFTNQPNDNPHTYGSRVAAIDGYGCSSVYAAFDSSTWRTFPNFAKPQTFDAYIMAEGPKGSTNDTEVSPDLIRLFTGIGNVDVFNNTQIGLGMPGTVLFTSSNLTVSPGQLYDPSHPRTCE